MARRILTLNVGSSKVLLAEYAITGRGAPVLVNYGAGDIMPVDNDALGSMEAALTPVLHGIMRETGIKPGRVNVTLAGQMVFPRFVKLPPVEASKLEQMVCYEVEQNVPFPLDEIVWDRQFTGVADTGEQTAVIVAAKVEHVRGVTDAVSAAGFTPEIVDVAPMAAGNAFRAGYPECEGCTLLLDIGARTTDLILCEGGKIYTRSIPAAGNTITKELAQAFGCSQEEAEQLKLQRGYVALGGVEEDPDEISDRVSKIARNVMNRLNAEISRSINFYRSQQGGSAPVRVLLTGGGSRLPYIDRFFAETLQTEVAWLDPFRCVEADPSLDSAALESDAFVLAESAGLALRATGGAMMNIDLLPPEITEARKNRKRIPLLACGAASLAAGLVLCAFAARHDASNARAKSKILKSRAAEIESAKAELAEAEKAVDAAVARHEEAFALLSSRMTVQRAVAAVRKSLVKGESGEENVFWVHSWETLPDGGGAKIVVRGWVEDVDRMKKRLNLRGEIDELIRDEVKKSEAVADAQLGSRSYIKATRGASRSEMNVIVEFPLTLRFAPVLPEKKKPAAAPAAAPSGDMDEGGAQ